MQRLKPFRRLGAYGTAEQAAEKLDGGRLVGLKAASRRRKQRNRDGTPKGVPLQNWSSSSFFNSL
jgi:hypothetical protein